MRIFTGYWGQMLQINKKYNQLAIQAICLRTAHCEKFSLQVGVHSLVSFIVFLIGYRGVGSFFKVGGQDEKLLYWQQKVSGQMPLFNKDIGKSGWARARPAHPAPTPLKYK